MTERQLVWAQRLQAIAQNGLHFSRDPYDRVRFEQVREICAEMLVEDSSPAPLVGALAIETGYATPKVDTRSVVVKDGRILLVREAADGLWTLPGGWADPGESPSQNAIREVREEAGLEVRASRLLAVYDRELRGHEPHFFFHVYKLFFHCKILSGELTPSEETPEVAFFDPAELPPLSLSRVTPDEIVRCLELLATPTNSTDFD
ncbi:MAG TPA: NUDIX hydrolase [Chthoniobacterales bacterium]